MFLAYFILFACVVLYYLSGLPKADFYSLDLTLMYILSYISYMIPVLVPSILALFYCLIVNRILRGHKKYKLYFLVNSVIVMVLPAILTIAALVFEISYYYRLMHAVSITMFTIGIINIVMFFAFFKVKNNLKKSNDLSL